jgi:UPF0755 protein
VKKFLLALVILGAIAAFFLWKPYMAIYGSGVPATLKERFLYVPTGTDFEGLVGLLEKGGFVKNAEAFRWVAERGEFKTVRAGRFEIEPGMTNLKLMQYLRSVGKQAPVKVVLNNERLPEEVAGKVARFIEADSLSLIQAFRDPALLNEIGYTPETLMAAFIPNTYEFYWNTDAKGFVKKMLEHQQAFWAKNDRKSKATALNMTPTQVYTLASIVERETNYNPEKPTIAGVYLNRLKIDMPLQADPTSVFATRDFGARRVTYYHTTFDSPYNTYRYKGLPPGPISMASISSIDAVLNREQHDYLYFCAKADESSTHAFASTLSAHNVNAAKFRAWMATKGL